jgi:predicted DCC family thiol-disulfide oxidoreductase YuxK
MHEHLIFFDSQCPFCHRAVQSIIETDKKEHFLFAPLGGETASRILTGPLTPYTKSNSLILIENYRSTYRQFWIRSKAIFRIYWLIGEGWGILGWLSFLPSFIGDFFYRWFAEHRHQFKLKMSKEPGPPDRFLP